MKIKFLLLIVLASCLAYSTSAEKLPKPQVSANPVGANSLAIYRDFLKSYNNGSGSALNISELTVPFQPNDSDRKGCLREFQASDFGSNIVHRFSADAFPPPSRLVDSQKQKVLNPGTAIKQGQPVEDAVKQGFASGVFTFSEIVFDSSHTHAALLFSFYCGSLCGNGGTLIYEKNDGAWKQTKSRCSQWIS
jgi:hypothetical protein